MAYADFTIERLKKQFGITIIENISLFPAPRRGLLSSELSTLLKYYFPLAQAIGTEKAKSEFIIAPILGELKRANGDVIGLFSGYDFDVDKDEGLTGRCDFIISKSSEQYAIEAPVLVMVEAKNDRLKDGVPQCIAEMLAANKFNQARENPIKMIYGVVSTGNIWKFLKLQDNRVYIDIDEYHFKEIEAILGILTDIVLS
jgi:hypothetical protein